MKIGDKVRFLSEVGGGVVTGFQGKDMVLVEDADGFDIPMPIKECVVIDTDDYNMKRKPVAPAPKQEVVSALSSIHEKEADVIFMDPPYQSGLEEPVLAALSRMPYVTDETLIVIEATLDRDFSFAEEYGFSIKKEKCYKTNKHVFLAKEEKK